MKSLKIEILLLLNFLGIYKLSKLDKALYHPTYRKHNLNSKYFMTDKGDTDTWRLVYYPIFHDSKTLVEHTEPKALMQNVDKPGFWSKEVPLRYIIPYTQPKGTNDSGPK